MRYAKVYSIPRFERATETHKISRVLQIAPILLHLLTRRAMTCLSTDVSQSKE